MDKIILVGGGGHCVSCIDVIELGGQFNIVMIIDLPEKFGLKTLSYQILGVDTDIPSLAKQFNNFHISIGQLDDGIKRERLYNRIIESGGNLPTIISPHAYVSKYATIGDGAIIMHGAIVNANASIGKNTIINSNTLIEHDAFIGNHCHIATAAVINGGVTVGNHSFIGTGVITKQYINIPPFSFIKANTFVK